MHRMIKWICLMFLLGSLSACSLMWHQGSESRKGASSSLVDYLYPKGEIPPEPAHQVPRLNLPLRAGIAFVPPAGPQLSDISEVQKARILETVKRQFQGLKYVSHIEVIPETYLRSSRGMTSMQQVARLYAVDVMALVSYDQIGMSTDKEASFFYWTIVGAYIVKGTENEVQTFVDTAVFDVGSRQLLFRAPGTDNRRRRATAMEVQYDLREDRGKSFDAASGQMVSNLAQELVRFEERLKQEPELAEVKWKRGRGGGSIGPGVLCALLAMALLRLLPGLAAPRPR